MKKMILITLAALIFIFLAFSVWVYLSANSIIAKYKPELEHLASNAAGTKVQLGEISVSMFPELALSLTKIKLGEETQDLSLKEVLVRLRLMPLLSGVLDFTSITVDSPRIILLKNGSGTSISGLPKKSKTSTQPPSHASAPPAKSTETSNLKVNLQKIAIKNGSLIFDDQVNQKKYSLDKLEFQSSVALSGTEVTLSELKAEAELAGRPLEISAHQIQYSLSEGMAQFQPVTLKLAKSKLAVDGQYRLSDGSGKIRLLQDTNLDLASLAVITREVGVNLPPLSGEVSPQLEITLQNYGPTVQGAVDLKSISCQTPSLRLTDLKGSILLSATEDQTSLSSKLLSLLVNDAPVELSVDALAMLSKKTLKLRSLNASLLSGNAEIKGDFSFSSATTDFDIKNISIPQAIAAFAPSAPKLQGTVANLKGVITLPLVGQNALQDASGTIYLKASDTSLPGVNLAGAVLGSVKDLPFLQGALLNSVPPNLQDEISADSTVIKSISANVAIAEGAMSTKDLYLTSNLFELDGQGSMNFDANLNLRSSIYFNRDFSLALANRTKELRSLFDADERLMIPLELKGHLPKVSVLPDTSKLLRLGAKNLVKEHAGQLLDKVLGGKGAAGKLFGF